MKRLVYILSGSLISALLIVGITWVIGALFGPLYQGEDESTRNFKIFLVIFVLSVVAGGLFGDRLFKRKTKSMK